jgi:hypothetical protein
MLMSSQELQSVGKGLTPILTSLPADITFPVRRYTFAERFKNFFGKD